MDKIEFIARARFLAWTCYQMGAGQEYNIEPTKDQLDSLMNGVKFGLQNPDATPESNHENWMKCKIEQGWVYGEVKDIEKKTHFDLIPFDELTKVEKDKDIMDCLMNKEFAKLWDESIKEKTYTIEQIKAYAHHWVKPSLSTDAMMQGESENERLLAFIYYIDQESDSSSIDRFLKRPDWEKHIEWSNNI